MADTVEKIYCDRGNSDSLAAAILANGRDDSLAPLLAAGGGMNSWMNNPFAYMMFLALFRNGGFGDNAQGAEVQAQLNSIRTQLQDNQNSSLVMDAVKGNDFALSQLSQNLNVDYNTLQRALCDVQSAIKQVEGMTGFSAERVINAANLGDLNIIQQLKDCCCQTQQNITRMGYENQLGQKDIVNGMQRGFEFVNRSVERGFSDLGYRLAADKCDIINAGNANTQRIIDTLNCHWNSELQQRYQDARMELSQLKQNETLIAALKS